MASAKPKKRTHAWRRAVKRVRQDVKINAANTSLRSKYRTAVKNVEKAVLAGDKVKAAEALPRHKAWLIPLPTRASSTRTRQLAIRAALAAKVKALALAA